MKKYVLLLNENLHNLEANMVCCSLFCITYIAPINDGFLGPKDKKRIFIDVVLRRFAFLDSNKLTLPQKTCLIENSLGFEGKTMNPSLLKDCGISSPYTSFPMRSSCMGEFQEVCDKSNFEDFSRRLNKFIPTNTKHLVQVAPKDCLIKPQNPTQKASCGSSLYDLYVTKGLKIHIRGIFTPTIGVNPATLRAQAAATNSTNSTAATGNKTVFFEYKEDEIQNTSTDAVFAQVNQLARSLLQLKQVAKTTPAPTTTTAPTSKYVEDSTNPEVKKSFSYSLTTSTETESVPEPVIDGSSASAANTNVEADLKSLVPETGTPKSTKSSGYIYINMIVLVVLAIFV